jgi:hypothetical protein
MANVVLTAAVWKGFPIAASAGNVTVTNNISAGPIYVRFLVGGVIANEWKLQPLEQKVVSFPAGATAIAGCGFNQTMTVV